MIRRTFLAVASFITAFCLLPSLALASTYTIDRLEPLHTVLKTDFFQPLAASGCHALLTVDRGIVVPIPTRRPTQGSNILTATDCSMTTASNGILDNERRSAEAIAGSVGMI